MTKGGKKVQLNKTLKKIAADNPVTGFVSGGVVMGKVLKAANALSSAGAGFSPVALALRSRIAAKEIGRSAAKPIAESTYLQNAASRQLQPLAGMMRSQFKADAKASGFASRASARGVFPQAARAEAESRLAKAQAAARKRERNRR
jgi:hypothetical protein